MKVTVTTTEGERVELTRTGDSVRIGFRVLGCSVKDMHRVWVAEDGREYVKARNTFWPVKRNTFDQSRADRRFDERMAF
jgi:hypothetical protein